MSLKHHFVCRLPNGVHARPASSLEEAARSFTSELILLNERTGRTANSKSVLSIISADIRYNDHCQLTAAGSDEQEAMAAMTTFVDDTFPHCDEALPPGPKLNGISHLPPSLRNSSVKIFSGMPVVSGVARGQLVQMGRFKTPATLKLDGAEDIHAEARLIEEGLRKLVVSYDRRLTTAKNGIESGLIKAHRSIVRDPEFRRLLEKAVRLHQRTAAGAIADAEAHFSTILTESESPLLRERALDIQDVCQQLLRQIYGDAAIGMIEPRLTADTILVAETLTPSQFLGLDRLFLKGLVMGQAGATSHTVILARSFGVPTLSGVRGLVGAGENQEAVVDANAGVLMMNLSEAARRYYTLESQCMADRQKRLEHFARQPAITQDGHRIEVAANISTADEAKEGFALGAEGVGLFRTEMLFFDRESSPGEEEQFETYSQVVAAAKGRPVIIRTLDVGGDKSLDYLNLPAEENPFLGCRAVRLYPEFEKLFRDQIRALVRASAHGQLKVMIPMVATLDEVRWVRKIIAEEQARCLSEKIAFDAKMPVGAMLEVPAAAFAMDGLCRELDFFSIGSNDLLQYFMAADRANTRVVGLYNPLQPAFLRLLQQIISHAHAHNKWIGLCGEMGGQTQVLPLLVGLGLDEISVTAPAIVGLKAELASLTLPDCQALLNEALKCGTAAEVAKLLEDFAEKHGPPLIDPDLIIVDADAVTKEEVIKLAVDKLYIPGRTKDSRVIEEAIWQREQTYSTGFGHGFAIPHCKSNAVASNSLVLVKLRAPVDWNSLDGQPVRLVILLVMRESEGANSHLKIFAKLARQIMNEEFRARLENENDAGKLCGFLRESIQT